MFGYVKKPAFAIYRRDKFYLWRLFAVIIAGYLIKDILLSFCAQLPIYWYEAIDVILSVLYVPFGVSIVHMLIHEEHYDHMGWDGLFRFYRKPVLMVRCMILGLLSTVAVEFVMFWVEEAVFFALPFEQWEIVLELALYIVEEALVAYLFLVQYLFVLHEGNTVGEIIGKSVRAMKGDILYHLCFDFSLLVWYLIPLLIWMGLCGVIGLATQEAFLLPSLELRELSGHPYSLLYMGIMVCFHMLYAPFMALAKILFAEHVWKEAKEKRKV